MMDSAALAQLLRERPGRFAQLAEFNYLPARYIDPSQLATELPAAVVAGARGCLPAERRLSALIRQRFSLSPGGYWDFDDERRRLALLAPTALRLLASLVASAGLWRRFRATIDRPGRAALLAAVGEPVFDFALRRAPLLGGAGIDEPLSLEDTLAAWSSARAQAVRNWFAGESPGLAGRVRLKFPSDWGLDFDQPPSASQRDAHWQLTRRVLKSELSQEWAQCCS